MLHWEYAGVGDVLLIFQLMVLEEESTYRGVYSFNGLLYKEDIL